MISLSKEDARFVLNALKVAESYAYVQAYKDLSEQVSDRLLSQLILEDYDKREIRRLGRIGQFKKDIEVGE